MLGMVCASYLTLHPFLVMEPEKKNVGNIKKAKCFWYKSQNLPLRWLFPFFLPFLSDDGRILRDEVKK